MGEQKLKFSAILVQGLASLSIAFSLTLIGLFFAWPSYTVKNFTSNTTVLSEPMSTIEISLLGSLSHLGALIATPFCGYALQKFGRRYSAILFDIPIVIAWAIVSFTTYVPLVLTAMGIGGLGAAGSMASLVYISEISHDSVRGAFTNFTVTLYLVGLQLSYILGGYLTYYQVIYVCLSLSIIQAVMLAILKESPVSLLQHGMEEEAANSIAFYRCVNIQSAEVDAEINKLKLQLNLNKETLFEDGNDVIEDLLSNQPKIDTSGVKSEWKMLMKSESSKRALIACLFIMITCSTMGIVVLQTYYAEPLFKEAIPSLDTSKCAMYLGLVFILSSFASAAIIDNLGRKSVLTASTTGTGICALLLGIQLLLHWAPHWCTALLIYSYGFMFSLGAADIPLILASEVFLPEVRALCSSIVIGSMWMSAFVSLFIFIPLVEAIGLGPVFCGFSIICFVNALYSKIHLPETKGLSADAIQLLFTKKKDEEK